MKKLNSWFEIDEHEYLMHLLKGYIITATENYVIWILDGKLHRENGPAVICSNGYKEWHLNDIKYSEAKFNEKIKQLV